MPPRSPLAPTGFPELKPIAGMRLAVANSGSRYKGRPDFLLAEFQSGTAAAGVLTQSRCPSAPVDWCRQNLPGGEARALVVNAGNANAFTGKAGWDAMEAVIKAAAETLNCRPSLSSASWLK